MKIFKYTLFLMIALILQSCNNSAKPSDASIKELLTLTEHKKMYDATMKSKDMTFQTALHEKFKCSKLTQSEQALVEKVHAKLISVMKETSSWAHWEEIAINIYRDAYTQKGIDDLTTSFKSPSGLAARKLHAQYHSDWLSDKWVGSGREEKSDMPPQAQNVNALKYMTPIIESNREIFTQKELEEIYDFYKTPTGQAAMDMIRLNVNVFRDATIGAGRAYTKNIEIELRKDPKEHEDYWLLRQRKACPSKSATAK